MRSSAGSATNIALNKAIDLHQNGQLQKADKIYSRILKKKPAHIDALHMRGVLKLEQGNHELAAHFLKKALNITDNDPWIHYHFAQVLAADNDHQAATIEFKKAIKAGATEADVYYTFANSLFELNLFSEAIENYLLALKHNPHDNDCRLNLANAYEATGELTRALQYLEPLSLSEHASVDLKLQLAEILVNAKRALQAHSVLLQLKNKVTANDVDHLLSTARHMQKNIRHDSTVYLLGLVSPYIDTFSQHQLDLTVGLLNDLGRYNESRELLDNHLSPSDRTAWSWFQQGICSQVAGDFEQAADCHHKALSIDDSLGAAAYSLATNGNTAIDDAVLEGWAKKKNDPNIADDRQAQFAFAVARLLDNRKDYDRAFEYYLKGNKLVANELPFDAERWELYTDSLIETFSADFFNQWRDCFESASENNETSGQQFSFIVGMPRSGSTMLEQTLKQRAGLTGLGEHHIMRRIVADIPELTEFKRTFPGCAADLLESHVKEFRHLYIASIGKKQPLFMPPINTPDCPTGQFVDKMLGNFVRLGVIALMFPKARILHSARDPMATGVSCFTNAFNSGLRFTYDLYSMGRAWQSYSRLMQHWHQVLPIPIMDVQYEKLVSDTDNYFQSVLQFMQLTEVDAQGHSPAVDDDTIATASFWQARQSISTKSLSSWERFDNYLDPLREGLQYNG